MDELQGRLVRVGLEVLDGYGFVLAGGYALQAHELVERMSEDVDLFTDRWDPNELSRAIDPVSEAYRGDGFEVTVVRRGETFARLQVGDPREGRLGSVDLATDMRCHEPARLSVGPVLAEVDAVATKVATVFSRGEARDYLDLAGVLDSGRFIPEELMDLAPGVDGGSSRGIFAEALAAIDRFPDDEFAGCGVDRRASRASERCCAPSAAARGSCGSGRDGADHTAGGRW